MTQFTPRLAAIYALYDVIVGRKSLSVTLNEQLSMLEKPADRGLCQEVVYGTLRNYPSLQATLAIFLKKKITTKNEPLEIILCAAMYQLYVLKSPSYAVINESVALVKPIDFEWAAGFINGVLRAANRVDDNKKILLTDKNRDHPSWLAKKIRSAYPEQAEQIFAANHQAARVMLRVRHLTRESYLAQLNQQDIAAIAHIDNKDAVVLTQSANIATLPLFAAGGVTVQDANAQLAANLLGVKSGMQILDACAAPGGKTAHIADKAANLDITAIDNIPSRVAIMQNTFQRLDVKATVITANVQNTAAWHTGQLFDRILLDAPCSATGVIRKHPDILFHRRENDLLELAAIQSTLLDTCWELLKPGGRLLYATCSILPEENSQQINAFLARTPNTLLKPLGHNRAVNGDQNRCGTLQFLPDAWGDGFFYASIEKPENTAIAT